MNTWRTQRPTDNGPWRSSSISIILEADKVSLGYPMFRLNELVLIARFTVDPPLRCARTAPEKRQAIPVEAAKKAPGAITYGS